MRIFLRKLSRGVLRGLLWLMLLVVLALLPLLAMLGSEGGSRWLLEQGVGMQRLISARYEGGTWLSGLELQDVNIRTKSVHVQIRHALARWSIVQLFRGNIQVDSLHASQVDIRLLKPPTGKPTKLPLLILPFTLIVDDLAVDVFRIIPWQSEHPFELEQGEVSATWSGSQIAIRHVKARYPLLGEARLSGNLYTKGDYNVEADGTLDMRWLYEKGLPPLQVKLRQSLADLVLNAESDGHLNASLQGRVQPLEPEVPYVATVDWKKFLSPWLPEQQFLTTHGHASITGNKNGLRSVGEGGFSGKNLPDAQYAWQAGTDWHSLSIDSLKMKGAVGQADVKGKLSWRQGLDWDLKGEFQQLDLVKQWPVIPVWVAPSMSGSAETTATMRADGSKLTALLKNNNGEGWQLDDKSTTRPWDLDAKHSGNIKWQKVNRYLPGIEQLSSQNGDMSYQGSLSAYQLSLAADLVSAKLPAGEWQGDIAGKGRHFSSNSLHYSGVAGELEWQGDLDLNNTVRWSGRVELARFSNAWITPEWPATFDGSVNTQGEWGNKQRQVHLQEAALTGELKETPVQINGDIFFRLPETNEQFPEVNASHLDFVWGDNTLELEGGRTLDDWNATLTLDIKSPGLLDERILGTIKGAAVLQGKAQAPDVLLDVTAENFGIDNFFVRNMSMAMELPELAMQPGHINLEAAGITLAGHEMAEVSATLSGSQDSHRLYWNVRTTYTTSQGELSGEYSRLLGQWQGQVESGQFSLPEFDWSLMQAFPVKWLSKERQLSFGAHCWASQKARFCSTDDALVGSAGHFRFALSGLEAERLTGLLPPGIVVNGLVSGSAEGDWSSGQRPAVQARLDMGSGQLKLARETEQSALILPFHGMSLAVDAGQEKIQALFSLASDTMGQGDLALAIDPYSEKKEVQGRLDLKGLRLEIAQPFFPGFSTLAGTISSQGYIDGTLQDPQFTGDVHLSKGELGVYKLPINLHDIDTQVSIKGSQATLSGTLMSGSGKADLSGKANWQEGFQLIAALKGSDLELRQQPELLATVNPDIEMRLVPGRIDLSGSLLMPMARFNIKSLSSDAVPLSSDIVFVDDKGILPIQTTQQVSKWEINADLNLQLGDDVFFHGYGVNGRLMGGLRLRQQGKKGLEASGEVELDKDARYDAYGQRLLIRRGRLIFAGNLTQPGLDAEAVREIDNETVGLRVEGRVSAPKVTFFSDDGGLSQEEIISYLVLGRPLDQQNGENNLSAVAAAIKLGATGGAGVTSMVGETLGITDLALDAEGSGDDTQVTVSGYLSPKLYLRYGVGVFTPVNTATLRYKINSKLYLEAVSSLESAIDVFYSFRF